MAKNKTALPSAFSLFFKSWEAVQRNATVFAVLYAIPLIGTLLSLGGGNGEKQDMKFSGTGSSVFAGWSPLSVVGVVSGVAVVAIAVMIVGVIIQALMIVAELESARGKTVSLSSLWTEAKPVVLRLFGLSILIGLIVFAGILLLIVPGLIAIRRYFLAPYFLVDKKMSIGAALKESAKASKPHSGAVWGVIGVAILLSLTGIVPVIGGLISFVLGVAYSVAPAIRYLEIQKAGY